jgi:hypothetical protein
MFDKSIEDWCVEFDITDYEIVNGIVNVNNRVIISMRNIDILPIKFGIITKYFYCYDNKLITLEGCPREVHNDFSCSGNQLKTLKYSPVKVGNHYFCIENEITTLKDGPKIIGGILHCDSNPIFEEYIKYDSYQHYMRTIKLKELIL